MKREKEKSFGIFPYSFKVVGYVLTGIGLVVAVYNAFIAHLDFWEIIWNFLVVSLTLVVFSKSKIQDERTLYLNTKLLAHTFITGVSVVLLFAIVRYLSPGFPLLSAQMWIVVVYVSYIGGKIKHRIGDNQ